jgi:xanthine/uracil permease
VTTGHWIVVPSAFAFGFNVNATSVILFVVLLLPPLISAFGFYPVVGAWDGQDVSGNRMAWGAFSIALTGVLAGVLGTFSGAVYPENVGLLRSSKVGSRWITMTCGGLFIAAGFVHKIGAVFVGIPSSVIGAAAVVMFAVIMMPGIEILAKVTWTPRAILVLGLPTVLAIGGVFVSPAVYAKYPLIARELITQPLVTGPFLLVVFYLLDRLLPNHAAKDETKATAVGTAVNR